MGRWADYIEEAESQLLAKPPRLAVIRAPDAPRQPVFNGVWAQFHDILPRAYVLKGRVGGFEFWEARK